MNSKTLKIAVLAGDGIGPEITKQALDVTIAICEKFGHKLEYEQAIVGATAIDQVGDPYPIQTHELCMQSDAVLFGAIGDPKYDNDPNAKVRPEQGLLRMRKSLGLFANIRPVTTFPQLIHKSPLRADIVDGADFMCIRELTGGMYLVVHKDEAKMEILLMTLAFTRVKKWNESFIFLINTLCNEEKK